MIVLGQLSDGGTPKAITRISTGFTMITPLRLLLSLFWVPDNFFLSHIFVLFLFSFFFTTTGNILKTQPSALLLSEAFGEEIIKTNFGVYWHKSKKGGLNEMSPRDEMSFDFWLEFQIFVWKYLIEDRNVLKLDISLFSKFFNDWRFLFQALTAVIGYGSILYVSI